MSNIKVHYQTALTHMLVKAAAYLLLGFVAIIPSADVQAAPLAKPLPNASVCPFPDTPCSSSAYEFAPYDLSFNLPKQLKWQTAHNSVHFYAIIIRSLKAISPEPGNPNDETECGGYVSERERLQVQAMFPCRKVFASRHGCSMVWYNNVNDQHNFLAVYAGKTYAEANQVLQNVKTTGRFASANIRKMQVVVDNGH